MSRATDILNKNLNITFKRVSDFVGMIKDVINSVNRIVPKCVETVGKYIKENPNRGEVLFLVLETSATKNSIVHCVIIENGVIIADSLKDIKHPKINNDIIDYGNGWEYKIKSRIPVSQIER